MRVLTATLAFLSALISLPLLFASFFLIRSSLVMPELAVWWQSGAVLLVLWVLGWYGFVGLLLFPGIAVLLALIRLGATTVILLQKPPCDSQRSRRWLTALALFPVLTVAAVIGLRETVVWWYGHDLGDRMHQSAQRLAHEQAYCVLTNAGELSRQGVEARAMVLDGLRQRFDIGPNTRFIKRPHAHLVVAEKYYLWSFGAGSFLGVPHSVYKSAARNRCTAISASV